MAYIYIHADVSNGASALKDALNLKKIKKENSRYVGGKDKVVLNWGSGNLPPEVKKSKVINSEAAVLIASDKLRTFDALADAKVSIPDFTTDSKTAYDWATKGMVVARQVLRGSGGAGIVLMHKDDPKTFVKAPLYTKYIPKEDEYRVHVMQGFIIDTQRKALRNGWIEQNGPPNYKVRNLENGFVYVREGFTAPQAVHAEAIKAIKALNLDFGAVDVIWNNKRQTAYVLEVNTAPGLEGTTVDKYAKALEKLI